MTCLSSTVPTGRERLYDRGYSREQIVGLFEFIDWVLQLSDEEDELFWEEVKTLEEEKKMSYVTTGERIGLKKGLLEEGREMVIEALNEQFGEVPTPIADAIRQIESRDLLRLLLRRAIRCSSLEEFKQTLDEHGYST